jgi:putative flavoprotein involved in K+ transport
MGEEALIVGGGPAGLAAAAMLRERGIDPLLVERAAALGASWRGHYRRLRLHTVRWLSALPGLAIPRRHGPWVSRADLVDYLEGYARTFKLRTLFATAVTRIEPGDGGWIARTAAGDIAARHVIVATGYNHTPYLPEWGPFDGELVHSSAYRDPAPYRGREVLVVGAGNSGAEIAADLAEGGASPVQLAVRTPPNVVPRSVLGIPTQAMAVALRPLPPRIVDGVARALRRMTIGDLRPYGIAPPPRGLYTRLLEGQIPILDVGLVRALKSGDVSIVAAVARFEGREVVLSDGRRLRPSAVIAATGYCRGLEPLVGHLRVLRDDGLPRCHGGTPAAPGLWFLGYANPISGALRESGRDARRIARAVQRS